MLNLWTIFNFLEQLYLGLSPQRIIKSYNIKAHIQDIEHIKHNCLLLGRIYIWCCLKFFLDFNN